MIEDINITLAREREKREEKKKKKEREKEREKKREKERENRYVTANTSSPETRKHRAAI